MYKFSQHTIERATKIIEMKRLKMHVAEFYYQDLAIDIYKSNPELLIEACGPDNNNFETFSKQLLMFCEMGNFKYDINKLKSSFCSYAKNAIKELFEEIESDNATEIEYGDFWLDRADYERERM